ncbi:MAG TPA: hypothetical protein PKD00_03075 [Burkholderiales bacterium]|mgnify:CR=1 FL=1|nr:hypothetical protein [Burkholderiales bacterium]
MNKTLEQEAQEYANSFEHDFESHEGNDWNCMIESFIAGTNSNFVKKEKVKVQLSIYVTILKQPNHNNDFRLYLIRKRDKLQKQLKNLENGTNS